MWSENRDGIKFLDKTSEPNNTFIKNIFSSIISFIMFPEDI
jgi:hypothetical protein